MKRLDYLKEVKDEYEERTKTAPTTVLHLKKTQKIGEAKVRLWVNNTISFWALLEQIRSKMGLKDANEALFYCVYEKGKDLGLETG